LIVNCPFAQFLKAVIFQTLNEQTVEFLHAFPFCQVIIQRQNSPAVSAAAGAKDGGVIEAASLCVNVQV
jgi:hypothetical protein